MDISTLNVWAEPVLIVLAATCWIFAAWQLHLRMDLHAEWIASIYNDVANDVFIHSSTVKNALSSIQQWQTMMNAAYDEHSERIAKLEQAQETWYKRLVRLEDGIETLSREGENRYQLCRNLLNAQYDDFLELRKKVERSEGLSIRHHINAKVARELANRAHEQALLAHVKAEGLQKSTHSVQFMPIEKVLARNADVIKKANKLANPEDETPEWMAPFEGLDDDFIEQPKRRV